MLIVDIVRLEGLFPTSPEGRTVTIRDLKVKIGELTVHSADVVLRGLHLPEHS